jgi:methylenetetrahydrofolate dehydrogenase (NADP+)/methenyltetrahydrofolate cyclohydrolase
MKLLEGKPIAAAVLDDVEADIRRLGGTPPSLVFVRVGEDPASVSYVESKRKTAERLGVNSRLDTFPQSISEEDLLAHIEALNRDPAVDAILVQAPLPPHIESQRIFNAVDPAKDVDGFGRQNLGRLVQEDPDAFVACTPLGIQEMIKRAGIQTEGRRVVVLGRSLIVGKPAALLFMQKGPFANATVTVAHSRSADLPALTREADILIAAIGRPGYVTASMVKEGATVIDVGINRVEDPSRTRGYRITGDVLFDEVAPKCEYITPVPGGVGLMTVAMLMHNTLKACRLRRSGK